MHADSSEALELPDKMKMACCHSGFPFLCQRIVLTSNVVFIMQRDAIDLGRVRIPRLFRIYLVPTLIGMLSLCAVTAIDGIFIGHGVGSDGLAAVNICYAPVMALMGLGLMLGMGASVVASIHLAGDNIKAARLNVTQSMLFGTLLMLLFLAVSLCSPSATGRLLGASDSLLPLVTDYMVWVFPSVLFQIWDAIGLFIVRLDGSPKYAMWCNVLPALLNIVLDYLFIFPLGMGLRGAAIATFISCVIGGLMVMVYLAFFARTLRVVRIKASIKSLRLSLRNIACQCKIGISAFLGESTMGVLMFLGNMAFMRYVGDAGVGAFSIACYYCPFVFMIGNAIAQSAQPIISYNYGLGSMERVHSAERLAIITALGVGLLVMAVFMLMPDRLVALFLDGVSPSATIAVNGLPLFASAFMAFIFNLTAIGYFQSIEKVVPSIVFALLRGAVFLVPSFLLLPSLFGVTGIWLSLAVSELLTSACIAAYYFLSR